MASSHPGAPVSAGVADRNPQGVPIIRPLRWPADAAALAALDTSYTSDQVLCVTVTDAGVTLSAERVDPPVTKRFPLGGGREELDPGLALVAELDERIVAYAAARHESWNRRVELRYLYVEPAWRGTGLGARLLEDVTSWARAVAARGLWLETQNINPGAIRFYRRQGFRLCGLDASLYDPQGPAGGEVALYFYLPLDGTPATSIHSGKGGS